MVLAKDRKVKWRRGLPFAPLPPALVLILLGLWINLSALWGWGAAKVRQLRWVETPCRIERFDIGIVGTRPLRFSPNLNFYYTFSGKEYRSQQLTPLQKPVEDYARLGRVRDTLVPGAIPREGVAAKCWVNPSAPETAVLSSLDEQPEGWWVKAPGGLLIIFFGVALQAYVVLVDIGALGRPAGTPRIVLVSSLAAALIVGLGIVFGFTREILAARRTNHWQPTPARVENIEAYQERKTRSLQIFYRYERDGRIYLSSRYQALDSVAVDGNVKAIASAHPEGSWLTAYVNPADPWSAVIDPGVNGNSAPLFLSVLAPVGAGLALWFSLRGGWRYRKLQDKRKSRAAQAV